ncbi:GEVED domain-containing protein [Flavobacterium chungnamense]|uniref:Fibronectin type-III domain-containing protein n=1 Tax=Flavobacterium chungnamense TaxID=706182 RepID=A0ABP7UBN7_9FLAO
MMISLQEKVTNAFLKNNITKTLLVVLLGFAGSNNLNAQVSQYSLDQLAVTTTAGAGVPVGSPYTNFPLVANYPTGAPAKTVLVATGVNVDDQIYTTNFGGAFNFNFKGANYTSLNVSTNGFVYFGTASGTPATEYNPVSSTNTYLGAISVYGRDMDFISTPATNTLGWRVVGTAPNRIYQVEWIARRSNAVNASPDGSVNMIFQLWMYESNGVIEMLYNPTNLSASNLTGQIGLRGDVNTDFNNLGYTNGGLPWPTGTMTTILSGVPNTNTSSVITRGTSTTAAATIQPTSYRLFRFTPVTCFAPGGLNVTGLTSSTATINWSAATPAPAFGYQYYVGTNPVPTGTTGSVGAGVLTAGLSSLTPGTQYYYAVRSVCSTSPSNVSSWSTVGTFTTYCLPVNTPYYEPFDGPVPNGTTPYHATTGLLLPICSSQQNIGAGNPWVTSSADYYTGSGMDQNILMYNGQNPGNSNPANVWFYTGGINLLASKSYTVDYLYGGTDVPSTVTNKMQVAFGTSPLAASMTTILDTHNNIKASPFGNKITFTPPADGVYYIGLRAFSDQNNGQLFVDDLQVYESICLKPTAVSVSSITGSTAFLSWTPPTPTPASGYVYYVSTSSTPPTNAAVPTGTTGSSSVTLTGLSGLTTYYFWVRSSCGAGDFGEWVALNNAGNPYFTTLVQINYCASLSTGNANYFTNFATSGAISDVSNATGYAPSGYANYTSQVITQARLGNVSVSTSYNDMAGGVGIAMWVDWNQDGTFDNTTERVYNSAAYLSAPPTINFTVPNTAALGITRMRIVVDWNATSPSACNAGIARGETEDYGFEVVTVPPALVIDNIDDTVCAGSPSNPIVITTGLASYQTFSWSPSTGVTGSGTVGDPYIITSSTTQTYTLTASQTASPFRFNKVKFVYTANPLPTPITVTPATPTMCQSGPAVQLTSSGGIVNGFPILSEGFNGATNSWTVTGSGSGSPIGNWTLRPNGYNIPLGAISSNDSSQFYHANSDAPGNGTTVTTTLTSPSFSLVGYTQASLSFWHIYRYFSGDTGTVQVSTNGTTWTTLSSYNSNQFGTTTGSFVQVLPITLNPYLGQANVQIRFVYTAGWDWFWAIDNVLVSGSASSAVTWNNLTTPVANGVPVPGLYTNAAATLPYIAGTGAISVYTMPSASTTFTASASTPSPVCSTVTEVPVTVSPVGTGTASGNQTICYGAPSNLTLTGTTGTITGWQYSATLAFTTPVAIPASASATLTSAQMGNLFATRYYRAVVTNGSCTAYSNVITVTYNETTWDGSAWSNGFPSATKTAIFDGDYTSIGDLNACSVYISSGDITFLGGHSLIVQNIVDTSGGTLTFENNSSLVQVVNGITNVGNITYKRTTTPVRKFDYTYWSSPVAPQTLVGLSPLTQYDKYYSFSPAINNWISETSTNLMIAGKGYIIRAPNTHDAVIPSIFNGQFFGVPNNGLISTPIVIGAADVNLIGNPYPSALNIDAFFDFNGLTTGTGVIEKTIYLWTHNTIITNNNYVNSDYAVYNYMGGIGTTGAPGANNAVPNGKVASGQSFFIKGLMNGSAVFNNTMRIAGLNNQFFRYNNQATTVNPGNKSRVWLEVFNNQGAYKQTMVGFAGGATNDYDSGYDGEILDSGSPVNFYSTLGIKKLAIQGRGLPFNENDIVPLGFKSTQAGSYEIKLSNFDGIFDTQKVYLEDKLLNIIHNIKLSNYTFTTNVGTFDNRFALRFTDSALQVNDQLFTDESLVVFKEDQTINITSSLTPMKSIQVFDIRGSLLFSNDKVNATEYKVINLNSSQQVLLVVVESQNGTKVSKKIIY